MSRVHVELQSSRTECGLACLAMIAGCFDPSIDLLALRRRWPAHKHGLTMQGLSSYAADLGFLCRGLRCEPAALKDLRKPVILHWNMDHFVVLVATTRRGCVLHDPASGRRKVPWAEVDRSFTGVALEVWPGADFQPSAARRDTLQLRDLWPLVRTGRADILRVLGLSIVLQAFVLAGPWHMQWTVDEAIVSGDVHLIGVLAVAFGGVLLLRTMAHWLRGALVVHLGHMLSFQFAGHLLRHLLRLPLTWFEQRHAGDVLSRFDALGPVQNLLTQGAAAMLVDALMVVLALGLMLVYEPMLALVVAGVHLGLALLNFAFVPRLKTQSMSTVVARAAEHSHLLESVRAIHNVKLYVQELTRERQWQQLHGHTLSCSMALQRTQLGVGTVLMLGAGAELIGIIYLGAMGVMNGAITLGMLIAFISYRSHFADRTRSLLDQLVGLQTLQVHLQRLAEIWCEEAEPAPVADPESAPGEEQLPPESLALRGVGFRYAEHGPWLVRQLDCEIDAGEFVAIVGGSGAGKTTLLKLMMGLIAPIEGQIHTGGRLLSDDNRAGYRRGVGCVLQQDGLFSGSIADNVALWRPPEPERLRLVLELVGIWSELMQLPMGLRTRIGEIGSGLSSGQVQRLLLARALYDEPRYLFLDEGTANLDARSAAGIQQIVADMSITRVVVTHDMEFAARADRILSLVNGRLCRLRNGAAQSAG